MRSVASDPPAVWLSWSSGKDCAWALHLLRTGGAGVGRVAVTGLLTTVSAEADRVAMHGVRRSLLRAQADAVGLPLQEVELPWPCPNETYAELMGAAVAGAVAQGVTGIAFGDLFLADIRAYREAQLVGSGIEPLFPLWGLDTTELAAEMVANGLRAVTVCTDPTRLPDEFAGRPFDAEFVAALPDEVDPCGENGEFHTFVTDAPGFAAPVAVTVGDVVHRDGLCFADLLPADDGNL